MLDSYGLEIGSRINIQRSDGRVHAAIITGYNEATRSVTVEWSENSETKGKEVDLRQLLSINNIHPVSDGANKQPSAQPPSHKQQPAKSRQSQPSSKQPPTSKSRAAAAAQQDRSPANPVPPRSARHQARVSNAHSNSKDQQGSLPSSKPAPKPQNIKKEDRKFAEMIDMARKKINPQPFDVGQDVFTDKITVCVRKRPVSRKERDHGEIDCVTCPDGQTTVIHEAKTKVDLTKYLENHEFRFDYSFGDSCKNNVIYKYTAQPLVRTIFEKGMATCFAYGQTGSGKTYTMAGSWEEGSSGKGEAGVYALAANDVFKLNASEYKDKNLSVSVSFFEIYGGKVFDLLNKQKRLRVLEDGNSQVQVVGLSEKVVSNLDDVKQLLLVGTRARATGTTSANDESSRSHAVFQILLRSNNSPRKVWGKFSLIDLAGNERGADTANSDRKTRIEGAEINKSLLALKECIRALGRKGSHTPFRASKLTQVLRDSFISKRAQTCMIAMISPGKSSCEHTLNTLRYADRVKELAPGKRRPVEHGNRPSSPLPDDMEDLDPDFLDEAEDEIGPLESSLVRRDIKKLQMSLKVHGEGSDDMFDFHQAVADVMEAEEKIIEEHRAAVQFDREMIAEEERLLEQVDGVDGDVEDYARRLESIVAEKIKRLQHLKTNLTTFRKQLQHEENASKHVKGLRFF